MTSYKAFTKSAVGLILLLATALQSDAFRTWFAPIVIAHPKLSIITGTAVLISALLHNPLVEGLLSQAGVDVSKPQAGFAKLGLLILIGAVALLVLPMVGCTPASIKTAAQTANDIAISLNNAEQLNEQAYASGVISAQDSLAVSRVIFDAVNANEQLIVQVKSVKTLTPANAALITAALGKLVDSVSTLEAQGTLHIKNAATKKQFDTYVAIVKAGIQVAQNLFASTAAQAGVATLTPTVMPPVPDEPEAFASRMVVHQACSLCLG